MAHPKRKISKTRRDKRRTHYKASTPQIATCPTTGEAHLYHRAHWHDGLTVRDGALLLSALLFAGLAAATGVYLYLGSDKTGSFLPF